MDQVAEEDVLNDGLEEWEIKLLENEDQPDFYDTLEVIDLKDKINKTAIAVVIFYILEGIIWFPSFLSLTGSYFRQFEGFTPLVYILTFLVTVFSVAVSIAITYFPLKALSSILRILMEMEFRSRKA